jgi:hypothetical protein
MLSTSRDRLLACTKGKNIVCVSHPCIACCVYFVTCTLQRLNLLHSYFWRINDIAGNDQDR